MSEPVTCRKAILPDDMPLCLHIRKAVFVEEQNVPVDLEIDGFDSYCQHYLIEQKGEPVATARVRTPEQGKAKIERVAVLKEYRGQKIGAQLMRFILDDLTARYNVIALEAQTQALPFYEKLGFEKTGEEFMDAGIPHYLMYLRKTEKAGE